MKKLVIQADDFGHSGPVNQAVLQTFRHGLVTSAALMSNMPGFRQACALATDWNIPLGIHINLTEGYPVNSAHAIPDLVDGQGRFLPKWRFLRSFYRGTLSLRQIGFEVDAQIERALYQGLTLYQLNSHHHIHAIPQLGTLFVEAASRYGIPWIRTLSVPASLSSIFRESGWMQMILGIASRQNPYKVCVSQFAGFEFMTASNKKRALIRELHHIKRDAELMCHPRWTCSAGQQEVDALCDHSISALLDRLEITRVSVGNVF